MREKTDRIGLYSYIHTYIYIRLLIQLDMSAVDENAHNISLHSRLPKKIRVAMQWRGILGIEACAQD